MEDLRSPQMTYMVHLNQNLHNIIPPDQRHRYHCLFGDRIMESFDTLQEASQFLTTCPVMMTLISPLD